MAGGTPTGDWVTQAEAILFRAGRVDRSFTGAPEIRRLILARLGQVQPGADIDEDRFLRFVDEALASQENDDPLGVAAIRELLCLVTHGSAAEAAAAYHHTEQALRADARFTGDFDPASRLSTRMTLAGWALGKQSGRRIWNGSTPAARARVNELLVKAIRGAIARPPHPPEAVNATGMAVAPIAGDRTVGRLEMLSGQFAADLDLVSIIREGRGAEVRLSRGHYVTRAREQRVLDILQRPGGTGHVVIVGDGGYGKSSLLWSVHRTLSRSPSTSPILISATWLLDDTGDPALVTVDEIVAVAHAKKAAGADCAVLLDTADLLLHGEAQRLQIVELQQRLANAEVNFALTVRPREAEMLASVVLERVELGAYDDSEVDAAITVLVGAYCPGTSVEVAQDMVHAAMARGLPVREVVRSPLTLRMWFENASPQLPSVEVDVTSIYRDYWRIRVAADRRGVALVHTALDFSAEARAIGVAMLGLGSPELGLDVASHHAAGQTHETIRAVESAVEVLARRGVLVVARGRVRFFHQTLFEFASAQGLLLRRREPTIAALTQRIDMQPDDLFVAAVVEQYLILLADDPTAAPDVGAMIEHLLGSDHPALHDLALVVWGHHPSLAIRPEVLAGVPTVALRRFARVAPTIAQLDIDGLLGCLEIIWSRNEPAAKRYVVDVLARLAPREPRAVAAALRELNCVADLVAADTSYAEYFESMRDVLPILETTAAVAPLGVREAIRTILLRAAKYPRGKELILQVLALLGRCWSSLRADGFLEDVTRLIVAAQRLSDSRGRDVREALGRLMAIDRIQVGVPDAEQWQCLVEAVAEQVEADREAPSAAAGLVAVCLVSAELEAGDPRLQLAVDRFFALRPPSAPWQPSRSAFPLLLEMACPAAEAVKDRLATALAGLPAPMNNPDPGVQLAAAVARATLEDVRVSPRVVADVAERAHLTPPDTWTAPDRLLSLVPAAAAGGITAATEILQRPAGAFSEWPDDAKRLLYSRMALRLPEDPSLLALMLDLAEQLDEIGFIGGMVENPALRDVLQHAQERLRQMVDRQLGGRLDQERKGAQLLLQLSRAGLVTGGFALASRRFESAKEPWARAALLQVLSGSATTGQERSRVIAACAHLLAVSIDPPAIASPAATHKTAVVLQEAARTVWLDMLAQSSEDRADIPLVIALATAPRIDGRGEVDSSLAKPVTALACRWARSERAGDASELVTTFDRATRHGSSKQQRMIANNLRSALRLIARHGTRANVDRLLDLVIDSHSALGRIIVESVASERFALSRTRLEDFLEMKELAPEVARVIHEQLKLRARIGGAGLFPEVLALPT